MSASRLSSAAAQWPHLICRSFSRRRRGRNEFLSLNKGVYRFCFSPPQAPSYHIFAYSLLLFIKLHLRDFSPCWLQPCLNFACFLKAGMKALDICWIFRWFLLPSVMDPSSYHLLGFFFTKQTTDTTHGLVCHISPVEWHEFFSHLGLQPSSITKLYGEGLLSATTTSALFLLCTGYAVWKRLLYSVLSPVCAISLMSFMFTSLLPFSMGFPLMWEGCSTLVLFEMNERLRDGVKVVCLCVCAQVFCFILIYTNLEFWLVLVRVANSQFHKTTASSGSNADERIHVHRIDFLTFTGGQL